MSIFRQIPPTAGWPIVLRDIFPIFSSSARKANLENDLKDYLGIDYIKVTNSGTAALFLMLETIKHLSSKKTVVIPSFVCPLVPLAIKRAGLNIEVCDIQSDNFNFNQQELEKICSNNNDILAIIAVHLAGIPLNLDNLTTVALKYKIFLIEDCAQSLGARYKEKFTGTYGDFSFFSFCRGKGLSIYEGGAVATKKANLASEFEKKFRDLVKLNFWGESLKILELAGLGIFYRPQLFWFVFNLPQQFWKLFGKEIKAAQEEFNSDFSVHKVSHFRQAVGHLSFYHLEDYMLDQRKRAKYFFSSLANIPGIKLIQEADSQKGNYPYVVLLFDSVEERKRALKSLGRLGLGAFQIYCKAIVDYPYLKDIIPPRDCPNGRAMASKHITLSTNSYLKKEDANRLIEAIKILQREINSSNSVTIYQ